MFLNGQRVVAHTLKIYLKLRHTQHHRHAREERTRLKAILRLVIFTATAVVRHRLAQIPRTKIKFAMSVLYRRDALIDAQFTERLGKCTAKLSEIAVCDKRI